MRHRLLDAKLCFVQGCFAWFTTANISEQPGWHWHSAPYNEWAGPPSFWSAGCGVPRYELVRVAWEADLVEACVIGEACSVVSINGYGRPWLRTPKYYAKVPSLFDKETLLWAGTTLLDFMKALRGLRGSIWLPAEGDHYIEETERLRREEEADDRTTMARLHS